VCAELEKAHFRREVEARRTVAMPSLLGRTDTMRLLTGKLFAGQ